MSSNKKEIAVIGGGAAGFFAAINCAMNFPDHRITIFEKSNKLLAKVRISGGGRCNVTHDCFDNRMLVKNYPRGEKQLMNAFARFSVADTIQWFSERGVTLKTEEDGRMFPVSNRSETIVNCLMNEADKYKVKIELNSELISLKKNPDESFELSFKNGNKISADKILIAAGGHPKSESLAWLCETGHELVSPVPSLFTFNIPGNSVTGLMGVSVPFAKLMIEGTKHQVQGPLLITHWGLSGPATLKLSAGAARELSDRNYNFKLSVSWLGDDSTEEILEKINSAKKENSSKQLSVYFPFELPRRLRFYLFDKIKISDTLRWADLSKEQGKKLINVLTQDIYDVRGKTTFKEEFVTSGGVNLDDVDFRTMESRKCKGIFFAGEVLDIDAYTGGFNFQAAWTTGFISGTNIGK